jgi:hypothetical protein
MEATTKQVPAHIAARVAARAGQKSPVLSALLSEGFSFPKISIRGSRYRLVEDAVETVVGTTLDVIIVGSNPQVSKIWYSKPFDGADAVKPDCFPNDGVKPDSTVESPFHSNCSGCPNNILGSKVTPNGSKTTICGSQRHLAVVPADDPTKVYGLTVTVSAMKALREYMKDLSNYGLIPEEVVTELGFDEGASFPKITFRQKPTNGFVPEKALKLIEEICASSEVRVVTRQDTGAAKLAAPKPVTAIAAPQEEEEPAPKAKAKPATPVEDDTAPKSNMKAMESKLSALFADD